MSYETSQRIDIKWVFTGWYVDNDINLTLWNQYSPALINARLDGKSTKIRPWRSIITTISSWTYPKWIIAYNEWLVVAHNQRFYFVDLSTNTATEIIGKSIVWANDFTTTIGSWTAVTNGSFKYWTTDITWMNFSSVTKLSEVWTIIQNAINTATSTTNSIVREDWTKLVINWTETLISAAGSWTDIRTLMWVNSYNSLDIYDSNRVLADDHRVWFVIAWEDLYILWWPNNSGTSNSTYWKIRWLSLSLPQYTGSLPTWFQPSFWVVFNGIMWVWWWASNPNLVYASVADNFDDFVSSWALQYPFTDTITWLSANSQWLFYFTKNWIYTTWPTDIQDVWWTLTYVNKPLTSEDWSICHWSIVKAWDRIFVLWSSNAIHEIVRWRSVVWYETEELSQRPYTGISNLMSRIDKNQTDSFGYFLPWDNLIKWYVKSNWNTVNDIWVVYDTSKNKFLIDSWVYYYDWTVLGSNYYTVSMNDWTIFQDEYWINDEDTAVEFEYWTKAFYVSSQAEMNKIFWEARTLVDINENTQLTQEIYVDWILVDTKTIDSDNINVPAPWPWLINIWGTAVGSAEQVDDVAETYILRTKWNLNVKWRTIQFRYTAQDLNQFVRLKQLSIKAEVLPAETNNNTI